ncbi:MAG: hypothetical protein IJC39_00120 [Firmicutes bacterium]|nr:hypothetical protein [Bacillota bacterium]
MFLYGKQINIEPVRMILSNEINDIGIFREQIDGGRFFTIIFIKEKSVIEYVMELLNTGKSIESEDGDLLSVNVQDGKLALVFRYFPERKLESFFDIQITDYISLQQASLSFVVKCMGSELPKELMWLVLEQENISIDRSGSVFFNYFIDFSRLSKDITKEALAQKTAFFIKTWFVKRFTKDSRRGKIKMPKPAELFVRKEEAGLFDSFADIYKDLRFMMEEVKNKPRGIKAFFAMMRSKFGITTDVVRVLLIIVIILITVVYVYTECKSRQIPAALFQEDAQR